MSSEPRITTVARSDGIKVRVNYLFIVIQYIVILAFMTVLSLELLIAGGARMVRAEPEAKGVAPAIIVGMPDS